MLNYNQLKKIKQAYDNAERSIISHNITLLLKSHKIKVYELETILGVSKHSAYAYTKERGYTVKPDLYNLMILAAFLEIDVMDFFQYPE
jgi:hypothetical protein